MHNFIVSLFVCVLLNFFVKSSYLLCLVFYALFLLIIIIIGTLDFKAKEWGISFSPLDFSLPNADIIKGEHFIALRSEEGEIGVSSYDKDTTKHFFVITKPLPTPKLVLKLHVCFLVE